MAEIPVVSTNLPQMKKIIDEFKVGFTINENDISGLTEVLFRLKTDDNFYNILKSNCQIVSQLLSWEKEIDRLFIKI